MFDIQVLQTYLAPIIVGICFCIGYILKNSFSKLPNKYIPAIMGVLGVALAVWIEGQFTAQVLLMGLISGLASTGSHQLFSQLKDTLTVEKDDEE